MIPLLAEMMRFLRYLFTPETPVAPVRYDGVAAGAVKAGVWMVLAVAAALALANLLGGAA
ncbi:MAG: hypothetical protein P4L39_03510 [Humidesulfovibrio sp.]|nr:hypothetical protein [Humidesulfovibrio sp.]